MSQSKQPISRAQRNTTLRRRATAASLGVLLSAFSLVAVTSQQSGSAAASIPPASTISAVNTMAVPASTTGISSPAVIQAGVTAQHSTSSHATTRQS